MTVLTCSTQERWEASYREREEYALNQPLFKLPSFWNLLEHQAKWTQMLAPCWGLQGLMSARSIGFSLSPLCFLLCFTGYSSPFLEVSAFPLITVKTAHTPTLAPLSLWWSSHSRHCSSFSLSDFSSSFISLPHGHSGLAWCTAAGEVSGFCYRPLLGDD